MSSEQYGFVFAVTYIIVFVGLTAAIPIELQGSGESPVINAPVDPQLLTGFADYNNYTKADFIGTGILTILYTLDSKDWICTRTDSTESFLLGYKIYWAGFLWLGGMSHVDFMSPSGKNLGNYLTTAQIDDDATEGEVRYNMIDESGNDAGGFVIYWNTTTYASSEDAWDNSKLYLLHGVGISATATNNVGSLLVGLLTLSLPDVPALLQLIIISPLGASIIYVLWYVIKEMIPFV